MRPRRLAAVLAAALASLLLATALFLHSRRVGVEVASPGEPSLGSMPAPPLPNASPADLGAPAGPNQSVYTNEMQAENLRRQQQAAGIKSISPPSNGSGAANRQQLMDQIAQARTPDEAVSALRQLSSMGQAAQEQAGHKPPVYLEGRTPKLLAQPGGAAVLVKGEPLSLEDWSGSGTESLGQSRVIQDADSWGGFWRAAFANEPLPAVDFSREEIAAVIVGPKPKGDGLQIVSAELEDKDFLISYRQTRTLSAAAFGPKPRWLCALKKIPAQAVPVRFAEVP